MITPKPPRANSETVYDQRTQLVKDMMFKHSAAQDAKTARLKALRLEKEAAEGPKPAPPAPKPKARAKKKTAR
jgi:hypothetical protein